MWKTLQLLAVPGLGYGLLTTWATDKLGHAHVKLYTAVDGADRFHAGHQIALTQFRFIGTTGLWLGRVLALLLVLCSVALVGATYVERPTRRLRLGLCGALTTTLFATVWFNARVTSTFLDSTFTPWLTGIALLCGLIGTFGPLLDADLKSPQASAP